VGSSVQLDGQIASKRGHGAQALERLSICAQHVTRVNLKKQEEGNESLSMGKTEVGQDKRSTALEALHNAEQTLHEVLNERGGHEIKLLVTLEERPVALLKALQVANVVVLKNVNEERVLTKVSVVKSRGLGHDADILIRETVAASAKGGSETSGEVAAL
jgi:hypothetical protein